MADDDDIRHLDPDRDDVPAPLLEREGERVILWTDDGPVDGVLVIVPGAWAHTRRIEEGLPPGPNAN
jgi:hypothetical protein